MDSNEDDEYLSDPKNLMLLVVGMVWQRLNRDIFKAIPHRKVGAILPEVI